MCPSSLMMSRYYVDAQQYPQWRSDALREVDPFTLIGENVDLMEQKARARYLEELLALIQVYPDGGLANEVAAQDLLRGEVLRQCPSPCRGFHTQLA